MKFYWVAFKYETTIKARKFCARRNAKLLKITSEFEFKVAISLVMEFSIEKDKPGKLKKNFLALCRGK